MAHGGRRTTWGQRRLAGRLTAAGEQRRGERRTVLWLTAAGEQRGDKGGLLAGSRRQENRGWLEFPTDHAGKLNAKRSLNEGKTHVCEIVRSIKQNVLSNKERNLKNGSV